MEKEKQAFEELVTHFEDYLCNVVGLDIEDFDDFMSEIGKRYSDDKDKEIAALKAVVDAPGWKLFMDVVDKGESDLAKENLMVSISRQSLIEIAKKYRNLKAEVERKDEINDYSHRHRSGETAGGLDGKMKQKLPLFIIFSKKVEVFYKPIETQIDSFDLLSIKQRFNIEPDRARVTYSLYKTMPQQGGTLEYWLRIDDSTIPDGFEVSGIEDRRDR